VGTTLADATCVATCQADCSTSCATSPPTFDCTTDCHTRCDAGCSASCTSTSSTSVCRRVRVRVGGGRLPRVLRRVLWNAVLTTHIFGKRQRDRFVGVRRRYVQRTGIGQGEGFVPSAEGQFERPVLGLRCGGCGTGRGRSTPRATISDSRRLARQSAMGLFSPGPERRWTDQPLARCSGHSRSTLLITAVRQQLEETRDFGEQQRAGPSRRWRTGDGWAHSRRAW
jgi:hypothetical protein